VRASVSPNTVMALTCIRANSAAISPVRSTLVSVVLARPGVVENLACADALCTGTGRSHGQPTASVHVLRSKEHPYSITSSARPNRESGTVMPSAFALFKLTTNWILVACFTVRSAPFRLSRCGPCRRRGQRSQRSARGVARAASQIDLQLLELGDVLIDALLPFLAQRFPDLRR
jgi:hypothetical protein